MDVSSYTGPAAFGRAYQYMLEHDTHAPGSVDRKLVRGIVRLCPETAELLYSSFTDLTVRYEPGSRPALERVLSKAGRAGPQGRPSEAMADKPRRPPEEALLTHIVAFTRDLATTVDDDLDNMRFGGLEEEIIARGSDWCTDVARVACVLCQVAGIPCRIVNLFNLDQAYSGHVIIEAYRSGAWGTADACTAVVYRKPDGRPASVWDLMCDPGLIEAHVGPDAFYTTVEQFRAAGIMNYYCWESDKYDYTVSNLNDYCRSILEMAEKGWPGGLRWLHGEDTTSG